MSAGLRGHGLLLVAGRGPESRRIGSGASGEHFHSTTSIVRRFSEGASERRFIRKSTDFMHREAWRRRPDTLGPLVEREASSEALTSETAKTLAWRIVEQLTFRLNDMIIVTLARSASWKPSRCTEKVSRREGSTHTAQLLHERLGS